MEGLLSDEKNEEVKEKFFENEEKYLRKLWILITKHGLIELFTEIIN